MDIFELLDVQLHFTTNRYKLNGKVTVNAGDSNAPAGTYGLYDMSHSGPWFKKDVDGVAQTYSYSPSENSYDNGATVCKITNATVQTTVTENFVVSSTSGGALTLGIYTDYLWFGTGFTNARHGDTTFGDFDVNGKVTHGDSFLQYENNGSDDIIKAPWIDSPELHAING